MSLEFQNVFAKYTVLRYLNNLLLVLGRYILLFGRARKTGSVAAQCLRFLLRRLQGYSKSLVGKWLTRLTKLCMSNIPHPPIPARQDWRIGWGIQILEGNHLDIFRINNIKNNIMLSVCPANFLLYILHNFFCRFATSFCIMSLSFRAFFKAALANFVLRIELHFFRQSCHHYEHAQMVRDVDLKPKGGY